MLHILYIYIYIYIYIYSSANESLSSWSPHTFLNECIITSHCAGSPSPTYFVIEQINPTTIRAQWVVLVEGIVRITYEEGSNGVVGINDTLTTETVITGLKNGANYTMSIVVLRNAPNNVPSHQIESNVLQLGIYYMNHFP